jgi:hypothetical protein
MGFRACVGVILSALGDGAIALVLPDRICPHIALCSTLLQARIGIDTKETACGHSHPGPA